MHHRDLGSTVCLVKTPVHDIYKIMKIPSCMIQLGTVVYMRRARVAERIDSFDQRSPFRRNIMYFPLEEKYRLYGDRPVQEATALSNGLGFSI